MKVTLTAYDCVCEECSNRFIDTDFSEFDYGTRIFRTKGGRHRALWIGYKDECFEEFQELMRRIAGDPMSPQKEADLFNRIFGISCDPIEQMPLDPLQSFVCPKCHSDQLKVFDIVPKQLISANLPIVGHVLWQKKGLEEKEAAIRAAIFAVAAEHRAVVAHGDNRGRPDRK